MKRHRPEVKSVLSAPLGCLGISMAVYAGLWTLFCEKTELASWIGFAGCTTYFACGKKKLQGIGSALAVNASGVCWAMLSIGLGNVWGWPGGPAVLCAYDRPYRRGPAKNSKKYFREFLHSSGKNVKIIYRDTAKRPLQRCIGLFLAILQAEEKKWKCRAYRKDRAEERRICMMHRGDAVVYKCRGLYKVEEIGTLDFLYSDSGRVYYTLQSVEDARDRVYVPADDKRHIRRPVSREEALELIGRMPDIEILHVKNEKLREQEYKDCISEYSPEGWVRVLKTAYSRTKSRGSVTSVDRKYQILLEHALYSEFSYALGVPQGKVPGFIAEYTKPAEDKVCG